MKEVAVPDIGDFKEVEVIEILVKPGDTVAAEQSLITVESDKASMEIPSPGAGVVKELRLKVGDKVSQGSAILVLEEAGAPAAPAPQAAPAAAPAAPSSASAAPRPAPAPAPASAEPMTVKVPDIGDFKEIEVIEVLVKPGDTVAKEQSLITLESDKATMEIPSPAAGVVQELRVKTGDKVSEGAAILVLKASGAGAPAALPAVAPAGAVASAPTAPSPSWSRTPISPAARRSTCRRFCAGRKGDPPVARLKRFRQRHQREKRHKALALRPPSPYVVAWCSLPATAIGFGRLVAWYSASGAHVARRL